MKVVVFCKSVPDTETRVRLKDNRLDKSEIKYILNPYDEFAVEQAVQFREAGGGKVTLVALFSEASSIDTDLRKMLAIGCDEAIVLRQPNYRGDRPAANAASRVRSRAAASNDAGTVNTTICSAIGASGCACSQAAIRCSRNRRDAVTGEILSSSAGA